MIHFTCPGCGSQYELEDEFVGVHAVCEVCNVKMTVPQGNGEEYVKAEFAEKPVGVPQSTEVPQQTEFPQPAEVS